MQCRQAGQAGRAFRMFFVLYMGFCVVCAFALFVWGFCRGFFAVFSRCLTRRHPAKVIISIKDNRTESMDKAGYSRGNSRGKTAQKPPQNKGNATQIRHRDPGPLCPAALPACVHALIACAAFHHVFS